jgi:hypothetical protein
MEMPEGFKRLIRAYEGRRPEAMINEYDILIGTQGKQMLDLMLEMAEALEKVHTAATEGQHAAYRETNNIYLKLVTSDVLKKWKEWK